MTTLNYIKNQNCKLCPMFYPETRMFSPSNLHYGCCLDKMISRRFRAKSGSKCITATANTFSDGYKTTMP